MHLRVGSQRWHQVQDWKRQPTSWKRGPRSKPAPFQDFWSLNRFSIRCLSALMIPIPPPSFYPRPQALHELTDWIKSQVRNRASSRSGASRWTVRVYFRLTDWFFPICCSSGDNSQMPYGSRSQSPALEPHQTLFHASASATALPQAVVSAAPPRSRVQPFDFTASFARP
jgi:hypothetical protein